jgi:competence CoiA-like predicted nuclease
MTEANGSNGSSVSVGVAEKGEPYTCPHCGDEVFPCQGDTLAWFFKHKLNNQCIGINQPAGVGL